MILWNLEIYFFLFLKTTIYEKGFLWQELNIYLSQR